ncbi:MAG: hypothetical protein AB7O55_23630 [Lautropia sp.]
MTSIYDPFPIPGHQGLTPTAPADAPLRRDAIAARIVDDVLRLILGDNELSGGPLRSSFHRWLMLGDASLSVEGEPIVEHGRLVYR